jgi:hypothetical protein
MKKFFTAIGVLAAAFALSLSTVSSAAAHPIEAPTPVKSRIESTVEPIEQRTCRARFSQGVNQRLHADTGATILGIIPPDTWVQASCDRVAGGEYTACGLTSNFWMQVYWDGAWGHSAWACVKDWEYTA